MGKASEPPKCKSCGKAHWGTCMDHDNRGYLSNRAAPARAKVKQQRIAKAVEVLASMPAKVQKPKKSSGGSSAVEQVPSKQTVGGSTPPPRSNESSPAKERGVASAAVLAAGVEPADSAASAKRGAGPKPRGRPKVVEDRKAYLAQKAKARRARQKQPKP